MESKSRFLMPGLAAASLVAAILLAPMMASAVSTIVSAKIEPDKTGLEVSIGTETPIANDGSDGAFGYGVLNAGDGSLMVATTHAGICDSELQSDTPTLFVDPDCAPIWHLHYVKLAGAEDICADTVVGPVQVAALTYASPGEVKILNSSIRMEDMPGEFNGINALTGTNMDFNPGTTANTAVSFVLTPVFNGPGGALSNVCVEEITPFAAETD